MAVNINQIKQLREETAVSLAECKKALEGSGGNMDKAKEILRKLGRDLANKRVEKEARSGIIYSYLHPNKRIGVLLELRCESDFVAKSKDFQDLAHELSLQVAAMDPLFVAEEDIPEDVLNKEKEIYQGQFEQSGKPEKIMKGIIEGKIKKFKEEKSLLSQVWIKDDSKTVKDLFDEFLVKIGEKIQIKRFIRYEI